MLFSKKKFYDPQGYNDVLNALRTKYGAAGLRYFEKEQAQMCFLSGLIKKRNPRKIVEVGVGSGTRSAVILKTLQALRSSAKFISVDSQSRLPADPRRKSGFLVDEFFSDLKKNWELYLGNSLPVYLENIGGEIDFIILDSSTVMPGVLLDFIVAMPFLSNDATIVFNNIHDHYFSNCDCISSKVAFDTIVGEKIICPDPSNKYSLPTLGAIEVTADTSKYINNLFSALTLPWNTVLDAKQILTYRSCIRKNYSAEHAEHFDFTVNCAAQKLLSDNNTTSISFENKKIDLFYHKHNCGDNSGTRTTERTVELALAKEFMLSVKHDLIEIGAVTPYYFDVSYDVVDPADEHPAVTKKMSLFDVDIKNKNVLAISVIEHIGTQDYDGVSANESSIDALNYILDNAKRFLITFPIGYNRDLQNYIFSKKLENANVCYYYRDINFNNWKHTTEVEKVCAMGYGPRWANCVAVIYRI